MKEKIMTKLFLFVLILIFTFVGNDLRNSKKVAIIYRYIPQYRKQFDYATFFL